MNQNAIHLHKFADLAVFQGVGEYGITYPNTYEIRENIKKMHPAQFLAAKISVPLFEVKISYLTARQNYRTCKKYMLLKADHLDIDIEIEMIVNDWVNKENQREYRKISNVQILEINPIAYAQIPIEC